jgi:succinate-acetate transporter protein
LATINGGGTVAAKAVSYALAAAVAWGGLLHLLAGSTQPDD